MTRLFFVLFIFFLVGPYSAAHASRCFPPEPEQSIANADLIFKGTIVSSAEVLPPKSDDPRKYYVRIGQKFKTVVRVDYLIKGILEGGDQPANLEVFSGEFKPAGHQYFVSGSVRENGEIWAYGCGTNFLSADETPNSRLLPLLTGFKSEKEQVDELVAKSEGEALLDAYKKRIDLLSRLKDYAQLRRTYEDVFEYMEKSQGYSKEGASACVGYSIPDTAPDFLRRGSGLYVLKAQPALFAEYVENFSNLKATDAVFSPACMLMNYADNEDMKKQGKEWLHIGLMRLGRQPDTGTLDLKGVKLKQIKLSNGDLHGADFSGATLDRFHFENVNLKGARFSKAIIKYGQFINCDFSDAIIDDIEFGPESVAGSNFDNVKFANNVLAGIEMKEKGKQAASFKGADLSRITLVHTMNFKQWEDVIYDCKTKFPEDFKPLAYDMVNADGSCEGDYVPNFIQKTYDKTERWILKPR